MKAFLLLILVCCSFAGKPNEFLRQVRAFSNCIMIGADYLREPEVKKQVNAIQRDLYVNPVETKDLLDQKIQPIRGISQVESCYQSYILKPLPVINF